jgi:hypothetical protein
MTFFTYLLSRLIYPALIMQELYEGELEAEG